MKIMGDRVILRMIEEQDQEMLTELMRIPEAGRMTGGYFGPASCHHQMEWFRSLPEDKRNLRSIIADRQRPERGFGILLLSNVDPDNKTAEIYIKLMASARGQGYGRDGVSALVSYAFLELGLNGICSSILEDNTASRRLFEACGFKQEGVYKSKAYKDGHCENVCLYVRRREVQEDGRVLA